MSGWKLKSIRKTLFLLRICRSLVEGYSQGFSIFIFFLPTSEKTEMAGKSR